LDFPIGSAHKVLLVRALSRLSEASECYPESLTLTDVTPECGRRATGGFADVYKGTCLGEDIALKVFKYPLPFGVNSLDTWNSSSDDHFKNLLREFVTWRQLSHPNILPFYGIHFWRNPWNPILPCVSLDGTWERSRILGSPESYGFLRCH
jgi:hypothetical protein